jgi:hypothetical protein
MMYLYSNGAVLEALRRVQFRQVPWPNRPRVFEFLRQQGLLETMRQPSRPVPGHHEPVDIAVLTARGKEEIGRLEQRERSSHWIDEKALVFVLAARAEAAVGSNRFEGRAASPGERTAPAPAATQRAASPTSIDESGTDYL